MRNAEQYITKQQQAHQHMVVNDYLSLAGLRRGHYHDVLDEELKIELSEDEEKYFREELKKQEGNQVS